MTARIHSLLWIQFILGGERLTTLVTKKSYLCIIFSQRKKIIFNTSGLKAAPGRSASRTIHCAAEKLIQELNFNFFKKCCHFVHNYQAVHFPLKIFLIIAYRFELES